MSVRTLACLAAASAFLTPPPAVSAQDMDRTAALGVGLRPANLVVDEDFMFRSIGPVAYFAVVVDDRFMIEPSLGLTRVRRSREDFGGDVQTFTFNWLRVGVGMYLLHEIEDDGRAYFGPRFMVGRVDWMDTEFPDRDDRRIEWGGAAVAGGEYLVASGLALGGDIALEYRRLGPTEAFPENRLSFLDVQGELRIRWYLR